MPETLKKLREPAALAAVLFAGLALLVAVINLLAPPSSNGYSEPFANRAHDQVGAFLNVVVAAAAAFAVYLVQHVAPALAKARLVTMAALGELGVALLFGVVTALAQFGADGVDGEGKFLTFLLALGEGAVVAVAALFVWQTWQLVNPQPARPAAGQPGQFGGGWTGGPGAGGQQQYAQPAPPPGGFGWAPQQGAQQTGQQPGQPAPAPSGFGQPQPGSDRTQLLPPVQGQHQPAAGYPQPPQPPVPPQPAAGLGGPGAHQQQLPVPPTMQDYAAQGNPWSPSGAGSAPPAHPGQAQQIPPARTEEPEQRGPFQVGDWRSE
jgi:hypothetical protein